MWTTNFWSGRTNMPGSIELHALADGRHFRKRRAVSWQRNVDYWLSSPLRHVADVGEYITDRAQAACSDSGVKQPILVDMGCGDGWLLRRLEQRHVGLTYYGLDFTREFIDHGRAEFAQLDKVIFELVDLERRCDRDFGADLVVNAFNFFELSDLDEAFANASRFLKPGGVLQVSTIDKTYLLLAVSTDMDDLRRKLRLYQTLPGIKYCFQPIDLGDQLSATLEYPSVLYSTEDYLNAARKQDLMLLRYTEHPFTASSVPKIYCHFEFQKPPASGSVRR